MKKPLKTVSTSRENKYTCILISACLNRNLSIAISVLAIPLKGLHNLALVKYPEGGINYLLYKTYFDFFTPER